MPKPVEDPVLLPGRGRVLIVEDSAAMRLVLASVLSAEHEVIQATHGEQALDLARSQRPDLILLDVVMPGLDGYQVCAHLKSDPRTEDIPVLFLTSLTGEEQETLALEAGAIDFVTKPLRPKVVAARVRNHMELKRLRDRIRYQANLDGLTGLPNRRRFDEAFLDAWASGAAAGTPLGLVLMDVDFFKRYNDALGHPAGDACLQRVAQVLANREAGPAALAARYGGEEFALLLPGAGRDQTVALAEGLRAAMEAEALPHPASDAGPVVTLSLGATSLVPAAGGNPRDLLLLADERLYQAKREGRNRVAG